MNGGWVGLDGKRKGCWREEMVGGVVLGEDVGVGSGGEVFVGVIGEGKVVRERVGEKVGEEKGLVGGWRGSIGSKEDIGG